MRMRVADVLVLFLVSGLFAGGGSVLGHFVGLELAEAGYIENPGPFESFGVGLCQTAFFAVFAGVGIGVGLWILRRWMRWAILVRWTQVLLAILIVAPLFVGGHLLGRFVGLELAEAGYMEHPGPFDSGPVRLCTTVAGWVFGLVGLLSALWIIRRRMRSRGSA